MYRIRAAIWEDLPEILKIYEYARDFMARTGNPNQWGKTNPPQAVLEEDIRGGNLYVAEDSAGIHGAFAFLPGEDPTYGYIEGTWRYNEAYAAVHRVASDGSGGIFGEILAFAGSKSGYLRIDTHEDNRVMQHVLEKHGFVRCGIIYLANGDPRIAYDRK